MKNYLVPSSLSILFLFFQGLIFAQSNTKPLCQVIQIPAFESVKYRAGIDVIGKHLSGILIFKKQEDATIRAVFINEIGVTFFDITFDSFHYTFNSIMSSLNKKAVKKSLAKDIGMILIRGIYRTNENLSQDRKYVELKLKQKGKVNYYPKQLCTQYPLIENWGRKKVISIQQFYTNETSNPDSIFVEHHKVNFTIRLKQMNVTE